MNWRQRLTAILWDQTVEQGGYVDLPMAVEELRRQCPGNFTIHWKKENSDIDLWEHVDELQVVVRFQDDRERVEWLLKWA